MFYVFDTELEAVTAIAAIDAAMGLPNAETKTTTWAQPMQRKTDNKFVVPVPPVAVDIEAPQEDYQQEWQGDGE